MTGIIDKVKEVLHKDHSSSTSTTHGTTGTGVGNTHSTTGAHSTTGTGIGHGTTGSSHPNAPAGTSTNAGPHGSNLANKADPRIDSDLDNHRNTGVNSGLGTSGHGSSGLHGTTGQSTNAGPHSSNLANKADPRVDSDLDSSRTGYNSNTTGTGYGSSTTGHNTHNTHNTNTTTPHSSNIANKMDPRIDSDRTVGAGSGTHVGNNHGGNTGFSGGVSGSTNAGPHDSNMANKVDPRVDSDLDGKGNRHGANTGGVFGASGSHATAGSGTAQNTAGPHNSDMLNKIDPRVDSDRDGSKTYGGNATHQ